MKIVFAAAALALATLGTAATAQMAAHDAMSSKDAMMSHDAMMAKIPAADRKHVTSCLAMTADAMGKSAMCAKMKKLYPAAFDYSPMVN